MGRPSPLTVNEIGPVFDALLHGPVALAVSGGADSMALMHLVAAWFKSRPRSSAAPIVLTVDHRLRTQSADEAAWVADEATHLGLTHTTLVWTDARPASGLQAEARMARYRLMSDFLDCELRDGAVPAKRSIVTAHHADDQAETFLMRLARGSGVDGLSSMRERETIQFTGPDAAVACTILRPLLDVPKARLIATLEELVIKWREDPSNASQDFERVRVRETLRLLEPLGVTATAIARSARRLARVRAAVTAELADVLPRLVQWHHGLFAEIDSSLFLSIPDELRVRALALVLEAFGGVSPPARLSQIEVLTEQMSDPGRPRHAATLGGCRIERDGECPILVWREAGRDGLAELDLQPGERAVWDGRFGVALAATETEPVRVRALGRDGVRALEPDLVRQSELQGRSPRAALGTLPSFWRGGHLLAVPYFRHLPIGTAGCSAEFLTAPTLPGHARPHLLTDG